ncbi:hypothetical protein D0Z08_03080 [Nocardioides immobilis]|uniref:DUF7224 domain-containing protein n=1 Tax=Nocardioides immobilis TaxID=2049295 RepID=A0A417Y8I2_9ACTN|nr:hypothetical protein [Nocardioides immobilis]RHW28841.1 hypothetical protein D0Z08_03080 [Nocardioides immobilis]
MDSRIRAALVLPVAGVGAYVLFSETHWMGGWAATIDIVTGSTVLTGPVIASVAAGLHLTSLRMRPISDAAARGWQVPYRSALDGWLVGVVAYLVTLALAVASTLLIPHGGPAQWWVLLAGVLVLALAALFGTLVTQVLPHPVAVLAAGPVLFLIGAFGPAPLPEVLRFGPTGSMTGGQIIPSVYLTRFAAVVAICIGLAVASAPWRERQRRPRLVAAAGAAVVAVLLGAGGVFATATGISETRLEASGERPTACAGEDPTVCVMPSHRRYLAAVRRSVDEAAPVLVDAGVTLPDRYQESSGGKVSEGSGTFYVDPYLTAERSFRDSVLLLARPADCPQWSSDKGPPYAAWDAEQLIAEWAVARHGGRPEAFNREMNAWLPQIDDGATRTWVVETFDMLKSCRFDRIVMPWE